MYKFIVQCLFELYNLNSKFWALINDLKFSNYSGRPRCECQQLICQQPTKTNMFSHRESCVRGKWGNIVHEFVQWRLSIKENEPSMCSITKENKRCHCEKCLFTIYELWIPLLFVTTTGNILWKLRFYPRGLKQTHHPHQGASK